MNPLVPVHRHLVEMQIGLANRLQNLGYLTTARQIEQQLGAAATYAGSAAYVRKPRSPKRFDPAGPDQARLRAS